MAQCLIYGMNITLIYLITAFENSIYIPAPIPRPVTAQNESVISRIVTTKKKIVPVENVLREGADETKIINK